MTLAARIAPEFPLPDSLAWLAPEPGRPAALQVRIVQHDRRDASVRVSQVGAVAHGEAASAFRRVERDELYATEEEAIGLPCKPCRGTGQRRRTRKGALTVTDCPRCQGKGRAFG